MRTRKSKTLYKTLDDIIDPDECIITPLSQRIQRGQAGEGTVGDGGKGVGREMSAILWIRGQYKREKIV